MVGMSEMSYGHIDRTDGNYDWLDVRKIDIDYVNQLSNLNKTIITLLTKMAKFEKVANLEQEGS